MKGMERPYLHVKKVDFHRNVVHVVTTGIVSSELGSLSRGGSRSLSGSGGSLGSVDTIVSDLAHDFRITPEIRALASSGAVHEVTLLITEQLKPVAVALSVLIAGFFFFGVIAILSSLSGSGRGLSGSGSRSLSGSGSGLSGSGSGSRSLSGSDLSLADLFDNGGLQLSSHMADVRPLSAP